MYQKAIGHTPPCFKNDEYMYEPLYLLVCQITTLHFIIEKHEPFDYHSNYLRTFFFFL